MTTNFRFHSGLLAGALLGAGLLGASAASGTVPVTDAKNTLLTLEQKLQDKVLAMRDWAMQELEMDVASVNSEAERAAQLESAMSASALAEMNDMTGHNLERAERAAPDADACLGMAVARAVAGEEAVRGRQAAVGEMARLHAERTERFGERIRVERASDGQVVEVENLARNQASADRHAASRLAAVCLGQDPRWAGLFDPASGQSRCLESSMLIAGRRAGGALLASGAHKDPNGAASAGAGPDEHDLDMMALRRQVELLVGAPAALLAPPSALAGADALADASRDMRAVLIQKLAATSLMEVMRAHLVPPGEERSLVANLRLYSANRWGSPAWLAEVSNSNGGEPTSPWQVLRKQASLDALSAHLDVLAHEQRLRMEALTAALLALEVNPL